MNETKEEQSSIERRRTPVRTRVFQEGVFDQDIAGGETLNEEELLIRAAEIIEEHTERLRRDDIRDLLARVQSGDVQIMVAEDGAE